MEGERVVTEFLKSWKVVGGFVCGLKFSSRKEIYI